MQYEAYHGTIFEFENFAESMQKDDLGFFFSEDPDDAGGYGDRVLKCSITLNNPYTLKSSDVFIGVNEINELKSPWCIGRELLEMWGYDGVIIVGSEKEKEITGEYESLYTQYIVFDTKQIEVLRCN